MTSYGEWRRTKRSDDLMALLKDPSTRMMSTEGQHIVRAVTELYRTDCDAKVSKTVYMMLLRLRAESPHAFAITVGQFPRCSDIEEYWRVHGFIDHDGFTWVAKSIGYGGE